MNKSISRSKYFYVFLVVLSLLLTLVAPVFPNKVSADNDPLVSLSHTSAIDQFIELCIRTIKGEINFTRPLVEKKIDLVIVQDASGSFETTIGTMKDGLKEVVDKLDTARGDRVMVTSFRGGKQYQWYETVSGSQQKKNIGSNHGLYQGTGSSFFDVETTTRYGLGNNLATAKSGINQIQVLGGTPTARGLQYALQEYNSARAAIGDTGDLLRETVFLLVTDGVANVRLPDGSAGDSGTIWLDWNWAYAPDGQAHPTGTGPDAATGFNEKYQDYKTATNQASAQAAAIKGQGYYLISTFIEDFAKQKTQYGGGNYYKDVVGPYTNTALQNMASSSSYYVVFDSPANFGTVVSDLFEALVEEISQESIEVVIEPGYQVLSSRLLKEGTVVNPNLNLQVGTNIIEVDHEGSYTIEYELKELDFYGEDKTPVVATGRSGQKRYNINNPVVPGNTNTVCTLVPTVPVKRVNGVEHYDLSQVREEVTYTVTTQVENIFGMTSFGFEDQVDALLKITPASADVKVDGVSIVKPGELTVLGNKITFTKTSDFGQIKGKTVVLEFKASIDACVICGEVKNVYPDGKIPNTATLLYNNSRVNSNRVTIAPPAPEVPQIAKDINGKTHENLATADQAFDYHVKVLLPVLPVGERYESLVIEDTLEDVLQIENTAVLIDGVADAALDAFVTRSGQTVTLTLESDDFNLDAAMGKVIALEITATLVPGADLSEYEGERVPNEGSYRVNGNPWVKSNTVTVTPPPVEPDIDKDVNGKIHEDLGSRHELFTYHLTIDIPESVRGYQSIVVTDTMESVLEIVDKKVSLGSDETLLAPYLTVTGQTATLTLDDAFDFSQLAGQRIVIELKARIRIGANLDAYVNDTVPNRASLAFNGKPAIQTEEVTVTPPAEPPVIVKDVNGKTYEDLATFDEAFTYHVNLAIPNNVRDYTSLLLTDTLEDVLQIIDAQVLLDGAASSVLAPHLSVAGQQVTLELDEDFDFSQLAKKTITLAIEARIRDGADLSPYEEETIPNLASYRLNGASEVESNEVTVTPPFEWPTIEKDVNGKEHEGLAARDESFVYHVRIDLPDHLGRYHDLFISDQLEEVLEILGASVLLDGSPDAGLTAALDVSGQWVRLHLAESELEGLTGKELTLRIEARIRAGADLDAYLDDTVPNQARLLVNEELAIWSNAVTVTPPPENPVIEKDVNDKTHEDLVARDELFVYHVNVEIPENVRAYESLVIRDTLEDVLKVVGAGVFVDGLESPALTALIEGPGPTLSVRLEGEELMGLAGKTVTLAILARIKPDADLTVYDGSTVPNKGEVLLNDGPAIESNEVTVTPPPEEPGIRKEVNGKEHEDLGGRGEIFTYRVKVDVPRDTHGYRSLVLTDTLEGALGTTGVAAYINGVEAPDLTARITVDGREIKLVLDREDDFSRLAGRELILEIKARILEEADLAGYEGGLIPNRAVLLFNGSALESNRVTVTPPPEEPGIRKEVNGKAHEDLTAWDQVFIYRVKVDVPRDIHGYRSLVLTDTLEEALGAIGVRAYVNGMERPDLTARITVAGREIKLILDREEDFAMLAGRELILEIKARILEDASLEGYEDGLIPNRAVLLFNGSALESNRVTVKPPEQVAGDEDVLPKTGSFLDRTLLWTLGGLLMAAGALALIRLKREEVEG